MLAAVLDENRIEIEIEPASPAASPEAVMDWDARLDLQIAAERSFVRYGLIGCGIGMVIGAGIWVGLVAIALVGSGWSLAGPLWMAAGVGVFAGAFLGSWAGIMVGAVGLERMEHQLRLVTPRSSNLG